MQILQRLWPGLWRDLMLNGLISSTLIPTPLRWLLLRAYGLRVDRCVVYPGSWFGSSNITIGRGSFINRDCMLVASGGISIGRNVYMAMGVLVNTTSHDLGHGDRRAGPGTAQPVTIEDGCFIGARVVINPGVTIGRGAVVGAGAVVVHDLPPHAVYAGTPARQIRALPATV